MNDNARLVIANSWIKILEDSDDPRAYGALVHYRAQRDRIIARIQDAVPPGTAQKIQLKTLNVSGQTIAPKG